MNPEHDYIDSAITVIKSCLLPTLSHDIGNHFTSNHFREFKNNLNTSLRLLFDLIEVKKAALLIKSDDDKINEFQKHLILLICEQLYYKNELFQSEHLELQQNLNSLLLNYGKIICNSNNIDYLLQYYEKQLNSSCWKRNLGALYGFVKFTELILDNGDDVYLKNKCIEKLSFFLSTGLLITDFFDPSIQLLGLKIFSYLLKQERLKPQLIEQNIHLVIYENIFRLTTKSNDRVFLKYLWACLFRCVEYNESVKHITVTKWRRFDDVFERLLDRIALEAKVSSSIFYLQQILMFALIYKKEESANMDVDNKPNYYIYRWVKKLLRIILNETTKFMADSKVLQTHLRNIHSVYLATISTVSTEMMGQNYVDFIDKLIPNLLDALNLNKDDKNIVTEIHSFLMTIRNHCKSDAIVNNLNVLLSEKIFVGVSQ